MDHHQPLEPDPGVERGAGRRRRPPARERSIAGAPGMGRVEAEPDRASAMPRAAIASAMAASSSRSTPSANPPPAEFSSTSRAGSGPSSTSARTRATPSASRAVPAATDVSRCEPMWTFTNRAVERGRRPQVVREELDRALEEVGLGAGEVDEVGGMDGDRADVPRGEPLAERRQLVGRLGAAAPGRRVVAEDLEGRRADLVGPLDGLRHAGRQRAGGHRAVGRLEAPAHRTMRAPWTTTCSPRSGRWPTRHGCASPDGWRASRVRGRPGHGARPVPRERPAPAGEAGRGRARVRLGAGPGRSPLASARGRRGTRSAPGRARARRASGLGPGVGPAGERLPRTSPGCCAASSRPTG